MDRIGKPFLKNKIVDILLDRTEIDMPDISADTADQVVMVAGHPDCISVLSGLPVDLFQNTETDEQVDRPE